MSALIMKGGWVMVPILLGSVVALSLVIERLWFFLRTGVDVPRFVSNVFSAVRAGNLREASELAAATRHPLGAVFSAGIEHAGEDPVEIERVLEREGGRQIQRMEKNLNLLVVVIGIEPLLGFLGTILGLIQAFMQWEQYSTSVTVSQLASGIYQAMITTAAGLIIAIPYFVIYHLFLGKVVSITADMNHYGDELLSLLAKARTGR